MEVPADRVDKAFARVYRQVGRQAKVRGFRPGKVPQHMLRGLYGTEIQSRALTDLLEEALAGAFEEHELEPVAEPKIEPGELNESQPFEFAVVVEVKPEIELGNYRGVAVERMRAEVDEESVERILGNLQERNAQLEPVEGRDRVEDGDYVLIDFSGSVDGEPFPGSSADNYPVDIGAGEAVPEFEQGLVGMERGVAGTIAVRLSADLEDERLAGKTADFEVTVRDIRSKVLAPLDDDFARDYGECDSLEELRDKVRSQFRGEIEGLRDRQAKDRIVERLMEDHAFEAPPSMVDRELSYLVQRAGSQRAPSGAADAPELTTDELREELKPQAERRVRTMLLIERIAAAEGITASDADVDVRIEALARASGGQADEVRRQYGQDWARATLLSQVVSEKTLDFLLQEAEVTEVDPPEKG